MTRTTGTQTLVCGVPTPRAEQPRGRHTGVSRFRNGRALANWLFSRTESDTSSIASEQLDETLYERLLALQDIIPASTRRSVSSKVSTASDWLKSGLLLGGKTLWVVSTSALLLGVPWALAYSEEQMIVEQERAELMNQRAQSEVRPRY